MTGQKRVLSLSIHTTNCDVMMGPVVIETLSMWYIARSSRRYCSFPIKHSQCSNWFNISREVFHVTLLRTPRAHLRKVLPGACPKYIKLTDTHCFWVDMSWLSNAPSLSWRQIITILTLMSDLPTCIANRSLRAALLHQPVSALAFPSSTSRFLRCSCTADTSASLCSSSLSSATRAWPNSMTSPRISPIRPYQDTRLAHLGDVSMKSCSEHIRKWEVNCFWIDIVWSIPAWSIPWRKQKFIRLGTTLPP